MVSPRDPATARAADARAQPRIVIDDDPRGHVPLHPKSMIAVCGAKPRLRWRQYFDGEPLCEACAELQSGAHIPEA